MPIKILKTGAFVDEGMVGGIEERLGFRLPAAYRAFLLEHNARVVRPCSIRVSTVARTDAVTLHDWTCFHPGHSCDANYRMGFYADRIPSGSFPIASDPGGNLFLLFVGEERRGEVHFWTHEQEVDEGEEPTMDNVYFVAAGFAELLERLEEW